MNQSALEAAIRCGLKFTLGAEPSHVPDGYVRTVHIDNCDTCECSYTICPHCGLHWIDCIHPDVGDLESYDYIEVDGELYAKQKEWV